MDMREDPVLREFAEACDAAYEETITRLAEKSGIPRPAFSAIMDQAKATSLDLLWYGRAPGFLVRELP